jgi:NAD(P)-dependent dehydrogenase (short-subunit alcohol dehydrogenase family)
MNPRTFGLIGGAALVAHQVWKRARLFDLRGRTVLISGGARGLGYLLAQEFGRLGARVVIFSRSLDELARAREALEARGIDALDLTCDVRNPDQVARLVSQVTQHTGRLDVIVNNAGIIQATPFEHTRYEDYEESLKVHFWGPLYLINEALPHLKRVRGRILNISSIGGRVGVPHLAPYCAGKFALTGLSETLRAELAKDGILVTTCTPGLMRTGSHVRAQFRGQHEAEARWFGASVATPLTSKHATRAARQIVKALREGRAHVTPGIQARFAEMINAIAPNTTAAMASAAVRTVLPGPSDESDGDTTRPAHEVGFGWMTPLLPNREAVKNNEVPSGARP